MLALKAFIKHWIKSQLTDEFILIDWRLILVLEGGITSKFFYHASDVTLVKKTTWAILKLDISMLCRYFTGNMLTGAMPDWMLKRGDN